jgi:hypothetical protein
LIDGMGAATENLTDLGVGQLLPHCQAEEFLVPGPQLGERVEDFLILSAAHHHSFWTRHRIAAEATEPGDEPTGTPLRTEPVGEDTTSNAIEPTKRLIIGRNIIDAPPRDQERLRRALPRGLNIRAASAVHIDVLVVGVEETPEPLLRPRQGRHLLPKLGSPMLMSGFEYRARSSCATRGICAFRRELDTYRGEAEDRFMGVATVGGPQPVLPPQALLEPVYGFRQTRP